MLYYTILYHTILYHTIFGNQLIVVPGEHRGRAAADAAPRAAITITIIYY